MALKLMNAVAKMVSDKASGKPGFKKPPANEEDSEAAKMANDNSAQVKEAKHVAKSAPPAGKSPKFGK